MDGTVRGGSARVDISPPAGITQGIWAAGKILPSPDNDFGSPAKVLWLPRLPPSARAGEPRPERRERREKMETGNEDFYLDFGQFLVEGLACW